MTVSYIWKYNYNYIAIHCYCYTPHKKIQQKTFPPAGVAPQGYLDHTTPLFTNLNLLKLTNIYYLNLGKFMFKQMNNLLPPCFKDICVFTSDVHCHVTRNSSRKHLYQYLIVLPYLKIVPNNVESNTGIVWPMMSSSVSLFKRLQKSLNLICSMILINLLIWSDLLPMLLLNVVLCICPVTCTLSLL